MEGILSNELLSVVSGIPQSYDIGRRLQADHAFQKLIEKILEHEVLSDYFDFHYVRNLLIAINSTDNELLMNRSASELLKFISLYLFMAKFAGESLTDYFKKKIMKTWEKPLLLSLDVCFTQSSECTPPEGGTEPGKIYVSGVDAALPTGPCFFS